VAIEREGEAHDLAIPAGEFQRIRAPAAIRADRRHLAVMLARPSASGMPLEKQPVLAHQPVDAFSVDRILPGGAPLAPEQRGDPPVAIGRTLVD
jgi:hypothetical protein